MFEMARKKVLPLLISKEDNQTIRKDDYKLGWLFKDENGNKAYWMTWGSSANLESALKVAQEVIEEKGRRDVFISDTPLTKNPTAEQVDVLKQVEFE